MHRKRSTMWKWIGGIVGFFVIIGILFAIVVYIDLRSTAKEIHEPLERDLSDKRESAVKFTKQEPFSVLVLGVDEREGDKGRSDTMIVLTVNPALQSTKMVSIPRDTYTEIVGKNFEDKLNHAYAYGGNEMAVASVEHLLDIPIDYVVQVNMKSFKDIVTAIGGVTVHNELDFNLEGYEFHQGDVTLTGDEALAYVRMRKEDPRGDFGRQDRQKQVIQAVLKQGASLNSLLNYKSIFNSIGENVRTNLTFDEMVDIQKNYRDATKNIDTLYVQEGEGKRMNGIWYYMMDETELATIQSTLKQHLGMTTAVSQAE